jgi:hypothetical protein
MRWLAIAMLVAGCTRSNDVQQCVPGAQMACPCPGGAQGAQDCNADGTGYNACQCPGGGGNDFAVGACNPDCPPEDLAGFDFAGDDLSANQDLSMPGDDLSQPLPDFSGLDLTGIDLTPPPPVDFSVPGVQCAVVMVVQDTTGSMGADFNNGSTTPSKLSAAETAVNKMVMDYGWRVPFGLTHFDTSLPDGTCANSVIIDVEPMLGSSSAVQQKEAAFVPGGGTNTGDAITKVAQDPNVHDATRKGSFAILITDGAPNCNTNEPAMSVSQIQTANSGATPLKTFVIGLGTLGTGIIDSDAVALDQMAQAGGVACTGGFCKGHKFYPAESPQGLAMALDLIMQAIVMSADTGECGNFACFPSGAMCTTSAPTCCGSAGCKNTTNDPSNCGSCDNVCGGSCVNSKCVCGTQTCPSGDRCCGSVCCSSLDMAAPLDMTPPPDLRPGPDMANGLPACNCAGITCFPGLCVADGCCQLITPTCTATPTLCNPS